MRPEREYKISEAAVRMYDAGVDVYTATQLELELWREMCPIIYVRRSVFRRAAKDVLGCDFLVENVDVILDISREPNGQKNAIHKTLLLVPFRLLKELLYRPFAQPDLQRVYTQMHLTLGKLTCELGLHDHAIQANQEALNRAEELGHDHPGDAKYRLLQSEALTGKALCYQDLHRFEEAHSAFREALDIAQQLAAEHPDDPSCHAAVAALQLKLGVLYEGTGRHPEADSILSQARERLDQSRQLRPTLDSILNVRRACRSNVDQVKPYRKWLHMALDAFLDASQAWRIMALHQLDMPDFRDKLIGGLAALAVMSVHAGQENLEKVDPQDPFHQDHFADFLYTFGLALENLDLPDQAKDAFGRAISIFEPLVREYAHVPEYQIGLLLAQSGMGRTAWRMESASYEWKPYAEMACPAIVKC
jgi:tetratricopeptide (TPR) repeat protein